MCAWSLTLKLTGETGKVETRPKCTQVHNINTTTDMQINSVIESHKELEYKRSHYAVGS